MIAAVVLSLALAGSAKAQVLVNTYFNTWGYNVATGILYEIPGTSVAIFDMNRDLVAAGFTNDVGTWNTLLYSYTFYFYVAWKDGYQQSGPTVFWATGNNQTVSIRMFPN